eukprot:NODE_3496_length_2027_cov_4.553684.p1 GENE.NODE_3496_length_2027_cov_4.553684~~NODE_3496_length_2027_cov_4.553684.p1  ORF type:complete len:596 (-),score=202.62 NODE_3496_length_2027_cov_4.553684:143-1930(-)
MCRRGAAAAGRPARGAPPRLPKTASQPLPPSRRPLLLPVRPLLSLLPTTVAATRRMGLASLLAVTGALPLLLLLLPGTAADASSDVFVHLTTPGAGADVSVEGRFRDIRAHLDAAQQALERAEALKLTCAMPEQQLQPHEAFKALHFWGFDADPTTARFARLLVEAGVPAKNVAFYDASPDCERLGDVPGVTCGLPEPLAPLEGAVTPAQELQELLGLWSPFDWPRATHLLNMFQSSKAFRSADVIICGAMQRACAHFAAAGKALLLIGTGLLFDHLAGGDCVWARTYADLLTCSTGKLPEACTQPLIARQSVMLTTSELERAYVVHVTGLSLPLLGTGVPSLPWLEASLNAELLRERREEVLLLPDSSRLLEGLQHAPPALVVEAWRAMLMGALGYAGIFADTASRLHGDDYGTEEVLQHRAAVVIPVGGHLLQMFDWYWAGVPVFVPSRKMLMELPREFFTGLLPAHMPCFAGQATLAGKAAQLQDVVEQAGDQVGDWCKKWTGVAPVPCFWFEESQRLFWLDRAWQYRAPMLYYWDSLEDLSRKLAAWTWEATVEHRARLQLLLVANLTGIRADLAAHLNVVAREGAGAMPR